MKVGEHPKPERPKGCPCDYPSALMLTYERPGLLRPAVESFFDTTHGIHLDVVDDGSESPEKLAELDWVKTTGATVTRLAHRGFIDAWGTVLRRERNYNRTSDCLIMLEDDIVFAHGWVEVLQDMQRGIDDLGFKQGMTSCFMQHRNPQNEVRDLRGVMAYQSMAHTWHCNMLPLEALKDWGVFEVAASEAKKSSQKGGLGLGIDVYYVGGLAHRLQRLSFVSTSSWVKHMGADESIVTGQGYKTCRHEGNNLVGELRLGGRI